MQGGGQQGGGIIPLPMPGKSTYNVIGAPDNQVLNSVWTSILLTKLSS